jgi:hypothetical protein
LSRERKDKKRFLRSLSFFKNGSDAYPHCPAARGGLGETIPLRLSIGTRFQRGDPQHFVPFYAGLLLSGCAGRIRRPRYFSKQITFGDRNHRYPPSQGADVWRWRSSSGKASSCQKRSPSSAQIILGFTTLIGPIPDYIENKNRHRIDLGPVAPPWLKMGEILGHGWHKHLHRRGTRGGPLGCVLIDARIAEQRCPLQVFISSHCGYDTQLATSLTPRCAVRHAVRFPLRHILCNRLTCSLICSCRNPSAVTFLYMCQTISFSKSSRDAPASLASLIAFFARSSSVGSEAKTRSWSPKHAGTQSRQSIFQVSGPLQVVNPTGQFVFQREQ